MFLKRIKSIFDLKKMEIKSEILIQDLIERTRVNINNVKSFSSLSIEELNWRMAQDTWSILECIEHLNLYGDFYIPEISKRIKESNKQPEPVFKSGFLGNYFAKMMLPPEKLNKMNTFKDKNPLGSNLDKTTIEKFLLQQEQILELLDKSRKVNLGKTKTTTSISKLIKLKLGDTFRVLIYHNERHIVQANKVLDRMPAAAISANHQVR